VRVTIITQTLRERKQGGRGVGNWRRGEQGKEEHKKTVLRSTSPKARVENVAKGRKKLLGTKSGSDFAIEQGSVIRPTGKKNPSGVEKKVGVPWSNWI